MWDLLWYHAILLHLSLCGPLHVRRGNFRFLLKEDVLLVLGDWVLDGVEGWKVQFIFLIFLKFVRSMVVMSIGQDACNVCWATFLSTSTASNFWQHLTIFVAAAGVLLRNIYVEFGIYRFSSNRCWHHHLHLRRSTFHHHCCCCLLLVVYCCLRVLLWIQVIESAVVLIWLRCVQFSKYSLLLKALLLELHQVMILFDFCWVGWRCGVINGLGPLLYLLNRTRWTAFFKEFGVLWGQGLARGDQVGFGPERSQFISWLSLFFFQLRDKVLLCNRIAL